MKTFLEWIGDDELLAMVAQKMWEIDPKSRKGAPVLVGDLKSKVESPKGEEFDKLLVRLDRAGKVSLLRYDPAFEATPLGPERLVSDGKYTYSGVALRSGTS